MKNLTTLTLAIVLAGCAGTETQKQHQLADRALDEAYRVGNSGPLYDHYTACLDNHWRKSIDLHTDTMDAFDAGMNACAYEQELLCDYYGVSTCYQDARMSNRYLFREILRSYADERRESSALDRWY